jgi:hypothetical protein
MNIHGKFLSLTIALLHLWMVGFGVVSHNHATPESHRIPVVKTHDCGDREIHKDLDKHHCLACMRTPGSAILVRGQAISFHLTPETVLYPSGKFYRFTAHIQHQFNRGPPLPSV